MKKIKVFLKNCGEIIIITLGVGVSLPFVLISVLIDYGKNIGELVIDTKDTIIKTIKLEKEEKVKEEKNVTFENIKREEQELEEDNVLKLTRKK